VPTFDAVLAIAVGPSIHLSFTLIGCTGVATLIKLVVCAYAELAWSCRLLQHDDDALKALKLGRPLLESAAAVSSGGFSSTTRWGEALGAAAKMLAAFHDELIKHKWTGAALGKAVAEAQAAVKQGLAAEDLPAKCATQLHRIRMLLESPSWSNESTDSKEKKRGMEKTKRKSQEVVPGVSNIASAARMKGPEMKRRKQKGAEKASVK
jgi:hypothetical protein